MSFIVDLCKLAVLLLLGIALSCTPEEEIISTEEGIRLSFSQDTVRFDTLFSTQKSITHALQVYNPEEKAVQTTIQLAGGNNSAYSIFINGTEGVHFENVLLRGGDSLLVLVEANIASRDEDAPFIVEDSLLFLTNGNQQGVKLLSWGQDAYFIESWQIDKDLVLSGERPYVIRDSIWVKENAMLQIPEGANIFFERGGSLWVDGSLEVTGSAERPVRFTYVRQDGPYANGTGQWQGILMSEKSQQHSIDHAIIRNAEVGLYISKPDEDTMPDLSISNTIIENMSVNGILAINSDIDAYNLVVNHCIVNAVGNFGKGYYRYVHCTFANDAVNFAREGSTAFFIDTLQADPSLSQAFHLELRNNIIWGNMENELSFILAEESSALAITSNLIKAAGADFPFSEANILNEDPQFTDPAIYKYALDSTSAAIDQGEITFVKEDIELKERDEKPDLGAYEYVKQIE
jgi:hypothetical protein